MPNELKIKLPKKLKIGGHVFDIVFPYRFPDTDTTGGESYPEECIIKINDHTAMGQPKSESTVWVYLFHEILHAIDQYTMYETFDNHETGEQACEAIAQYLYQVLNDNDLLKKPT